MIEKLEKPLLVFLAVVNINYAASVRHVENAFAPEVKTKVCTVAKVPTLATELKSSEEYTGSNKSASYKVYYNSKHEISAYIDPDGNAFAYSKETIDALVKKAKQSGEPELLEVLPLKYSDICEPTRELESSSKIEQSEENTKKEISQTVSPDFLKKRGITIHNSEDIKLYIRPSAFENDGILKKFIPGYDKTIDIYIGCGPGMSAYHYSELPITEEEKKGIFYDYNILPKDKNGKAYTYSPNVLRQMQIEDINIELDLVRKKYDSYPFQLIEKIAKAKAKLNIIETCSDKEMIDYYVINQFEKMVSEKTLSNFSDAFGRALLFEDKHNIIAIAAGRLDTQQYIAFYVKPNGLFEQTHIDIENNNRFRTALSMNHSPQPSSSFPSLKDYVEYEKSEKNDARGKKYKWKEWPFVHAINHEISHLERKNNFETDELAAMQVDRAHIHWSLSGYKDNSKYPFVFLKTKDNTITITQALSPTVAV